MKQEPSHSDSQEHAAPQTEPDPLASAEKYRALFDLMDQAYAEVEVLRDEEHGTWRDFHVLEVNPAFTKHTGIKSPVGKTGAQLLGTPNTRWAKLFGMVAETGETIRVEEREATLDRIFDLCIFRLGASDNRRVAVLFTDITERRRVEAALAAEKQYAEAIVETFHEPLLVLKPNLEVQSANPAFYKHFQVSPQETIGRKIFDLGNGQWNIPELRTLLEYVLPDSNVFEDHEVTHEFETIGRRVMLLNGRRLDHVQLILLGIRDITERVLAEESQREIAEQFRRAIIDAPIPVIMQAEDGQVLQISRSWTELTGYTMADLPTAESWLTRAYGPGADAVRLHMHDLFLGNMKTLDVMFKIVTKNGTERYWSFSASAAGMLCDGRRFLVGMAVDITDRKRVEETVRITEERLRLIIESARDYAIFTIDSNRLVTEWLRGAQAVFGWKKDEIEGRSADILYVPEDRERGEPEKEVATADRAGKAPDIRWHLHQDGHRVFIEGQVLPLTAGGKHSGYLKIGRDVTVRRAAESALREKEERLSLAIEIGELASWDWDVTTGAVTWNDRHYLMQGYAVGEVTPSFEVWFSRVYPEDRAETIRLIEQARDKRTIYAHEFRTQHADGQVRWCSARGRFFYDQLGNPVRMIGVMEDVTERKRIEFNLRESEENLRQLNAALDERVQVQTRELLLREERLKILSSQLIEKEHEERKRLATFLHDDVQQLLVAAKMQLGMVQRYAGPETVSQFLSISNLLDESLHATRTMVAELVPPILRDQGLGDALRWLAGRFEQQHGLKVILDAESHADPGDLLLREILFQAARELLFNVVKHASTDHAWLVLKQSATENSLCVRDGGVGFEVKNILGNPGGGGYGLRSLRERLDQVGGRIRIESVPHDGTQVCVVVPTNPPLKKDENLPAAQHEVKRRSSNDQPIRVLIVDDHQIVRAGIEGILVADAEIDVVGEAATGAEAMEQSELLEPDVIIMDVNLPDIDGIEASKKIKARLPGTRILAFTLHTHQEIAASLREAGIPAYVGKDADPQTIIQAIHDLMST